MKEENQCESPMGGWFGECQKTDKKGVWYATGIGKAVALVSYYNKSQGMNNMFTYKMCKDCVKEYRFTADCADMESVDNVVTEIEYFDKTIPRQLFNQPIFDANTGELLVD